jgi:hypothetical protein
VCRNYTCQLPTEDADELIAQLGSSPAAPVDDRV